MPAKKGVAKSASHKKSIGKSVGKFYSGGNKKRDGVESNNKFDSKKRLRIVNKDEQKELATVPPKIKTRKKPAKKKVKFGDRTKDATQGALGAPLRSTKIDPKKVAAARAVAKEQGQFTSVARKGFTSAKKKQAREAKVFGGSPGKGPTGKKGIIMGQSERATAQQATQSSQPFNSDKTRIPGGNTLAGVLSGKKPKQERIGSMTRKLNF